MDWIKFDKEKIPEPLCFQSGGWFYIVQDGGIHGKSMSPAWWSGTEFGRHNMNNITHFMKIEFPEFPEIF